MIPFFLSCDFCLILCAFSHHIRPTAYRLLWRSRASHVGIHVAIRDYATTRDRITGDRPLDQVSAVFEAVGKRYVEATRVVSMPPIPRLPFAHYSVNVAHFPSRMDTLLAVLDRCCPVPCKVIVYTSTTRQAEWLAARLRQDVDVDVVVLHNGMDSGAREASRVTFRVSDASERSLLLVCSGSDLGPGHDP